MVRVNCSCCVLLFFVFDHCAVCVDISSLFNLCLFVVCCVLSLFVVWLCVVVRALFVLVDFFVVVCCC